MKARFFAFLAAVAVGSAAVLIYASQTQGNSSASLAGTDDCSACEMSAKPATTVAASMSAASDECCAAEAAAKPAVASLASGGCPYEAGASATTVLADLQPAKAAGDACCPSEAAGATVAAQVEK